VSEQRDGLIFALDVETLEDARVWAERLEGSVGWIKIGSRLFCAEGPPVVEVLRRYGFKVFLDLKFHDIPNQVKGGCREISRMGIKMLTVHSSGGPAMLAAAVEGAQAGAAAAGETPPTVLAVTVLTSLDGDALRRMGIERSPAQQVMLLATMAREAGVGGIVCSPKELPEIRPALPRPFVLVCPGIRPAGVSLDDQARTATPGSAMAAGADHLVVGRPIKAAKDPRAAAALILEQMAAGAGG
jgi:orotidine-5'-phosphate decarboxylase